MMRTLDNLATRYHLLPSEALSRATTLDLEVMNLSTLWENHREQEAERKRSNVNSGPPRAPELSQEQMKAMVAAVKRNKK